MKNVFLFPGQGAHVNKIPVLKNYDKSLYNEEMRIISDAYGIDILDFALNVSTSTLSQVKYTQLVMFASSIALLTVAKKNGLEPTVVAGHSIGQYAALYAAECYDLFEAAQLIKQRADLMSAVNTIGKLCAIKAPFPIDIEKVKAICEDIAENSKKIIDLALINSDKQLVVGGEIEALSDFISILKSENLGYTTAILPVGQAFHTGLMKSMVAPFAKCIDCMTIRKPKIMIILNTTGKMYTGENLKQELLNHCVKPVQWLSTMELILKFDNIKIYEVGLGHSLAGFFRNISKIKVIPMEDKRFFLQSIYS